MGSILYDFLNESPLLDPSMIDEMYSLISENDLRSELDRYRSHCIAHFNDLLAEIGGEQMSLRLFAGKPFRRIDSLKQAAFYLDAVVLPDPLFPHTQLLSKLGEVISQYLNSRNCCLLRSLSDTGERPKSHPLAATRMDGYCRTN
jgi:hypothetical protein